MTALPALSTHFSSEFYLHFSLLLSHILFSNKFSLEDSSVLGPYAMPSGTAYRYFEGSQCMHVHGEALGFFDPIDDKTTYLRILGSYLPVCTV